MLRHGCTLSDKKERDFWQRMPEVSFFNHKWRRAGIGAPRLNVVNQEGDSGKGAEGRMYG